MCGSPSKATAPVDSPATGGTNRITVPARPQSTCGVAGRSGAGRDRPVVARRCRRATPSAVQRRGHQQGVARAQRPAYDGRAVGERGEHQRAVGQRLAAGQRRPRVDRAGARGAGHGSRARRRVTRAAYRAAQVELGLGAAWPRGGRPGARCRASRRASLAARRARQATPGLPSVSPAAMSRPPSIETFLKKWTLLVARWRRVRLLPEAVPGQRWSAPARRPAAVEAGAGRGRWPARRRRRPGRRVDPDQGGRVGRDRRLGHGLLGQRDELVGDRLAPLGPSAGAFLRALTPPTTNIEASIGRAISLLTVMGPSYTTRERVPVAPRRRHAQSQVTVDRVVVGVGVGRRAGRGEGQPRIGVRPTACTASAVASVTVQVSARSPAARSGRRTWSAPGRR